MKYKGIELKEITEPQVFDPPKEMLVWDAEDEKLSVLNICAIIKNREFPVISDYSTWKHCAEIPAEELKLATNRELCQWLARGNGELRFEETSSTCYTYFCCQLERSNEPVPSRYLVRKWSDTGWQKPTREYLGLEAK